MSKRIAAIAGLLVAFGATAAVAVAIWSDRAEDAVPSRRRPRTAPKSSSEEGDQRRRHLGELGDAALRMVDSRFTLERRHSRSP